MRLALAQVNPVVGDLPANSSLIIAQAQAAVSHGAHLLLAPEMALTGYPVEDLALRPSFQDASRAALAKLAADLVDAGCEELVCVIGYLDRLDDVDTEILGRPRRGPVNAAGVVHHGKVIGRYVKHHLPNYGVFDESRYFVPGDQPLYLRWAGATITLAICEDLWQPGGPVRWARDANASMLLVLNASPFERDKDDIRADLCAQRAIQSGATLAYVNQVGGQDELVFDGDSMVVSAAGTVLARASQFTPELLLCDVTLEASAAPSTFLTISGDLPNCPPISPRVAPAMEEIAQIYQALVLGLADYVNKNGFSSVLLGLSGGIDSALVAAIACDALGAERVFGIAMPSQYSSHHSVEDAYELARLTGLNIRTVPIASMVAAFQGELNLSGLAEENLQARVRGTTLMALSNAEGHLVLATGNKSEISVGYSTIYGDAVGGFAPIKDVPKSLVWELARWRNAHAKSASQTGPIPERSITKEPSAELRPDQLDSDSLPDYSVLDRMLEAYVDGDHSAASLAGAGFDPAEVERILRLTDLAEYKRRQYPPGTKISLRAFGRDRRLPITNQWREQV